MPINPTTLKAQIDTEITNETVDFAITPGDVGGRMKDSIDYTTEQIALAEVLTNKSTDVSTDGTSDIKYPSVKAVKDYVDQEVLSTQKFKAIVLKIERDTGSGAYTVTEILNDFPSINFTCEDSSTTGTSITADANVFTANKTEIISGIYNGSGTNIYFFTDGGDALQTLRILKFCKYDGSQTRPSGFNIKITIKVYN